MLDVYGLTRPGMLWRLSRRKGIDAGNRGWAIPAVMPLVTRLVVARQLSSEQSCRRNDVGRQPYLVVFHNLAFDVSQVAKTCSEGLLR